MKQTHAHLEAQREEHRARLAAYVPPSKPSRTAQVAANVAHGAPVLAVAFCLASFLGVVVWGVVAARFWTAGAFGALGLVAASAVVGALRRK